MAVSAQMIPHLVVDQTAAPIEGNHATGTQHLSQLTSTPLNARLHPRNRQTKSHRRFMLRQPFKIDKCDRLSIVLG